jgi:hypothetical protein
VDGGDARERLARRDAPMTAQAHLAFMHAASPFVCARLALGEERTLAFVSFRAVASHAGRELLASGAAHAAL